MWISVGSETTNTQFVVIIGGVIAGLLLGIIVCCLIFHHRQRKAASIDHEFVNLAHESQARVALVNES